MKKPQPKPADRSTGATSVSVPLVKVPFRDGHLLAADGHHDQEGDRPIPLRPFVDRLGLAISPQLRKLKRCKWTCVIMMITQMPGDTQAREVACLPLRAIPMWLATINASKVAPKARPMLEAYQREAADVLYRHFMPQVAANDVPEVSPEMFATVVTLLGALRDEVAILRAERLAPVGVLGKNKAEAWVKRPIRALAKQTAPLEGEPYKSQRTRLENALRFTINFFGPWDAMPEATLPAVQRHLFEVERQMLRRMTRRGRGLAKTWPGQLPLDLRAQQQAKAN